MKPSVIIALLVGGIVGFAAGSMFNKSPPAPVAAAPTAPFAAAAAPAVPAPTAPRPPAPPPGADTLYKVPVGSSPVLGNPSALVTLIEYSDYECPFCSRAHTTVKQLQADYGDRLRVVMKQNPLPFHSNAAPAAKAALAAGRQGKYWAMHDKLFENQRALDQASLEKYASEIGLDMAKWKADLSSPEIAAQIEQEQSLARQLGATGTPAFFINGKKLSGAQPIDRFKAIIDAELTSAQALVASGTPPGALYERIIERGVSQAPVPPTPPPSAPPPAVFRKVDVPADAPAKGPKHAKVTIVVWSDFQCPFCARVVPTLKQIEDAYAKDVKVVFRHQPLPFHDKAKVAAEASMAAHEQGKFWAMHDKLFANQQALDRPSLEKYASELGLDVGKFKAALDSGKFGKYVDEDSKAGNAVGANGTPTFFVNGKELVGAQPFEAFKTAIDEAIKKADQVLARDIKLEDLYAVLMKEAANAPPPPPPPSEPAPVVVKDLKLDGAPSRGPKNAPITLVIFSDFQCPFCSRAVPTLQQIDKEYPGKVRSVFMNQPLPFHDKARLAAAAGLAANEQGKFWEMHDKMFANQQALDRASLERYASELGLDVGKFKAALDSNKFESRVSADQAEANRVGANGTPTFYINGRQLVGAQPFPAFKAIIDEELKKR